MQNWGKGVKKKTAKADYNSTPTSRAMLLSMLLLIMSLSLRSSHRTANFDEKVEAAFNILVAFLANLSDQQKCEHRHAIL